MNKNRSYLETHTLIKETRRLVPRLFLTFSLLVMLSGWLQAGIVPVFASGPPDWGESKATSASQPEAQPSVSIPSLFRFVHTVQNDKTNSLVGVYVQNQFAFPVTLQPAGRPDFVSAKPDVVTQFSLAANFNNIGLLAHNYLAGSSFFGLYESQKLVLIYGDGSMQKYSIQSIERYRALSPNSPYSSFENLDNPGRIISVEELFYNVYGKGDRLVFQTCIEANGILSWGRIFITAVPIEEPAQISYTYRPEKMRID
jgi:hypothetical protein